MVKVLRYLPRCPFCREKINFLEVFVYKNKSLFKCRFCKKPLHSTLKPGIYVLVALCALGSLAAFLLCTLFESKFLVLGFSLTLTFFIIFYTVFPFFVNFSPSVYIKKKSLKFHNNPPREDLTKKSKITNTPFEESEEQFNKNDKFCDDNDIFSN